MKINENENFTAINYIDRNDWHPSLLDSPITSDNIPNLSKFPRKTFMENENYCFRVCAINTCGIGEFGMVSSSFSLSIFFIRGLIFCLSLFF